MVALSLSVMQCWCCWLAALPALLCSRSDRIGVRERFIPTYTLAIDNIIDFNGCLWRGRLLEYSTFHLNPISFIKTSGQAVLRDTVHPPTNFEHIAFASQHHHKTLYVHIASKCTVKRTLLFHMLPLCTHYYSSHTLVSYSLVLKAF